jgi:hypothetical protein
MQPAQHNRSMGFLLKIILFGVAVYALWRTVAHWKGLFDRVTGKAQPPARPAPPQPPQRQQQPSARAQVIDATASCPMCNAYLSNAATKCGRSDCPLPEARRA